MFPTGLVGVALLLLRVSVAATLAINSVNRRPSADSFWITASFVLAGLSLCLGLLTPFFSIFSSLFQFAILVCVGGNRFQLITSIVGSGIVSILGPGAFSIDSRIFGRKVLEVPPQE
jgi:uncharacterized membrane protein YphA (DoxX/SURF4 family)